MAPRLPVALVAGAVATAALVGCSDTAPAPGAATPGGYIAAVQELMEPPSQLAASIAEAGERGGPPPTATRRRLSALAERAAERLAGFRALRLDDPVVRRQRDRLAGAYARLLPRMSAAADGLGARDRGALRRATDPFLDALEALPSAVSQPSR